MFERGRIMKKELLLALRDYSFGLTKVEFQDWTDGIISGCNVVAKENHLIIEPGIIKFNKFIYIMTEPQHIHYEATEQLSVVKIRFSTTAASTTDFVNYSGYSVIEQETNLSENELEVCRFKLKQGSRLRHDYTDFHDIQTEYDTINLAHATWAGPDRPGIALPILKWFGKEAMSCYLTESWDVNFCSLCMTGGMIHRDVLEGYLRFAGMVVSGEETNLEIYQMLSDRLDYLKRNRKEPKQAGRKRPMIVLD